MKTKQLKQHINNTGDTARFLIDSVDDKLVKRFDKACKDLNKTLDEIRKLYPEAFILADTQHLSLYIGNKNMGDYNYEGYSKYSVTKNPEFIASSNVIDHLDIEI